jgi:hypothetical protein
MKRTFYIIDDGQESAGIKPLESQVYIKDNLIDNEITVKYWKETLSTHYDVPEKQVMAEKEYLAQQIQDIEQSEIPQAKEAIFIYRDKGDEPSAITEETFLNAQIEKLEQLKKKHGKLKS